MFHVPALRSHLSNTVAFGLQTNRQWEAYVWPWEIQELDLGLRDVREHLDDRIAEVVDIWRLPMPGDVAGAAGCTVCNEVSLDAIDGAPVARRESWLMDPKASFRSYDFAGGELALRDGRRRAVAFSGHYLDTVAPNADFFVGERVGDGRAWSRAAAEPAAFASRSMATATGLVGRPVVGRLTGTDEERVAAIVGAELQLRDRAGMLRASAGVTGARALAASPDRRSFVVARDGGLVEERAWDGRVLRSANTGTALAQVSSVALDPSGDIAYVVGAQAGTTWLIRLALDGRGQLAAYKPPTAALGGALAVRRDGVVALSVYDTRNVEPTT